ncbi:MAG: LytR family transcriptional regulator [Salinibacterium sp.]|nr:MAG: LytR family transcriptional regulator [Salinibacterium sp.]
MNELRPRSDSRSRSAGAPAGIARHGRLKKQHGISTILRLFALSLAVILLSGGSIAAIAYNKIMHPATKVLPALQAAPPEVGAIQGGFNILIVGSDTRQGQGGIGGNAAVETSVLNDVNILLHVSQDQTNAVAISFPRDMVVGIPQCPWKNGHGTKGYSTEPLNVALYYGGLNCAVMTIHELTGLPIQYAGMITFKGVINMSDAVGGVDVCVNGPMRDTYTGLNLPKAGTYNLHGLQALQFLRSRHGVGDGSDLTRISSQQVYLSSLVRTLKSKETLSDPKKLYDLAQAAFSNDNMTLSSSLGNMNTMVSIALALKNIPIERVTFVQYPGRTGGTGLYSGKVQPNRALGDQMMALVRADKPFRLEAAGDGRGSEKNAQAPKPTETADPSAEPIDNSHLPVLSGVHGQTAADYTCSIANN